MLEMDNYNILIGGFLSVIFILAALVHIRENTKLEAKFSKKLDADMAAWMTRFAWSRTLQLLGALGLCVILFINYDKELADSRNSLDILTAMVERKDKIEQEILAKQSQVPAKKQQAAAIQPATPVVAVAPVQQAPAAAPVPAAVANIVNTAAVQPAAIQLAATSPATPTVPQPTPQAYVAPAQPVTPAGNSAPTIKLPNPATNTDIAAPDVEESPIMPPDEASENTTVVAIDDNGYDAEENGVEQVQKTKNETIEALYNPQSEVNDKQSSMDDIKKRYEDILVIHLFLKKCNRVKPADFKIINYAISQEILALDAPKQLQKDIINASQGSYNEVYAKSPCNGRGIRDLQAQYHSYIDVLRHNFPM
jgi:hypothetical protein